MSLVFGGQNHHDIRGEPSIGLKEASTSRLMTSVAKLFAPPCSPVSTRMG